MTVIEEAQGKPKIPLSHGDESWRKRRLASGALLELWLYDEAPAEVLEEIATQRTDHKNWEGEFVILRARAADDWHSNELANALGQNRWRSTDFKYKGVSCLAVVVFR